MKSQEIRPYFLLFLLGGSFLLAFFIFKPFLGPLLLAAMFAVILQPLYKEMLSRMQSWPSLAAVATILVAIIIILIPLSVLGSLILNEAESLFASLSGRGGDALIRTALEQVEKTLSPYFPQFSGLSATFSDTVGEYARKGLQWGINHLGPAFTSAAGFVLSFFVFFIALYYLLRDGPAVKKTVIRLSPLADHDDVIVFQRLQSGINSVVKGNLLIAFIQGIVSGIGYTIFGLPNSALWGGVTAVAALIPGIGTALVVIPAVLFLFFAEGSGSAIGLAIWGTFAVGLIDNLLGPRLVGRGMQLHPLLILLSVLGGLSFFGPIGIFLGPLSLTLFFAFLTIYLETS